jgi:acetoin utilization deacetylase AcuC-like enzyme
MELGGHVFPVEKYRALKEVLIGAGLLREEDILEPEKSTKEDLLLVHEPEYLDDFYNLRWTHRTSFSELPLNETIVEGFLLMAGGTYLAAKAAVSSNRIGFHIGGGFHHAYRDHAEGFCYINDIAFAIEKLRKEKIIERAAVIDCDLHQGNGTAGIFRNIDEVFTFSIHQEYLYPYPKERSDWDVGLPNGTGDEEYLSLLRDAVPKILDQHKPQLVVYQAGADPYHGDQLGNLNLTMNGLRRRDEIVIGETRLRMIPLVITLGGGYAFRFEDVVKIHQQTAEVSIKIEKEGIEQWQRP